MLETETKTSNIRKEHRTKARPESSKQLKIQTNMIRKTTSVITNTRSKNPFGCSC